MKRYQKQSPWPPWLSLEMLSRGPSPKAQVRWGLSCHLAASARVKGVRTRSTFKGSSLQMCQPQVPRLCTRCDPWELRWGEELGVHSCRWRGHQHSLGNGWVHSGKEKKKCHFSFFLFEVTKLQGSGGDCCSDFILWEAGGCLPEAAACRVICIACPLWFWRGALPSLRPSASLESGPLPHTDCIRPLIFPTPPTPWLTPCSLTSFPDRSRGLIPITLKASWQTKEELFPTLLVAGCWREVLWGTLQGPLASLPLSHPSPREADT